MKTAWYQVKYYWGLWRTMMRKAKPYTEPENIRDIKIKIDGNY